MIRFIELVLATLLALALMPAMILVAILIRALDGAPVVFSAQRAGRGGRLFRMHKFRTMSVAERRGVTGGNKSDDITALGKCLRRFRLDELPQIFNVISGGMTFVGPRPPDPEYVLLEPEIYRKVLSEKPGITGLATIMCHRREEAILARARSEGEADVLYRSLCLKRKAKIDLIYKHRKSVGFGVWIAILTAIRAMGISHKGRFWRLRSAPRAKGLQTFANRPMPARRLHRAPARFGGVQNNANTAPIIVDPAMAYPPSINVSLKGRPP